MKFSFFRVASFSFVARQSPRPGLSSAGPGFRCANSFAHLQVGVANPSTGPSPGTLGELLNRPPRPEGRRGYGAQIFDFSAPSRAKALPHYSPSLVGLMPSLLLSPSVTARLEVRKRRLRTGTPARRFEGARSATRGVRIVDSPPHPRPSKGRTWAKSKAGAKI